MNIYISGKIGEDPISDKTREKFDRARRILEDRGHKVYCPTDPAWQNILKVTHEHYKKMIPGHLRDRYSLFLIKDLEFITEMDAIYVLPDYIDSPGARVELAFAKAIGKTIIYQIKNE